MIPFLFALALASVRPNPAVTPGAVNPNVTQAQLCSASWHTRSVRPPAALTRRLKIKQMKRLGLPGTTALYEEDHLISLELGGDPGFVRSKGKWIATSERNLWPEPWNGACGAHVKDQLENALHAKVCSGTLSLVEAQGAISSDWVAAYNKYLKPAKPLTCS